MFAAKSDVHPWFRGVARAIALFGMATIGLGSATAAPLASPWSEGFHSKVRMTAATLLANGNGTELYAGVDIRLDKNWKTYWKAPGDGGGIPPEFNWSQSQNVKAVRVMYPIPKLLKDVDGFSLGYKDNVLFPVSVTPLNPNLPVRLRLNVYYGVCEEICIPAEAALKLDVKPNARAALPVQRDLMKAISKVPEVAASTSSILNVDLKLTDAKVPHALLTVANVSPDRMVKLFATSRNGDYLPIPKLVGRTVEGNPTFKVDFRHVDKPKELIGSTLDLVIADGERGAQMPWTIQAAK